MSNSPIVCSNLSFVWPDGGVAFRDFSCAFGNGRTGLIAPNGAGKSTLLKLIAGELVPASGGIRVRGTLGYLPQNLPFAGDPSVADVLGIAPVLDALQGLASGEVSAALLEVIGDDWDIQERTRAQLQSLGIGEVAFSRRLSTFSGGEVISLGLAAQLLKRPDVLLLDEPTNNLDREARGKLHRVIGDWKGCLLLVSHDRELLERMDQIAVLESSELRLYGGNFSAYEAAVQVKHAAIEKRIQSARQEVKREKHEMQLAHERIQRRTHNAARRLPDANLPAIAAGLRKHFGEVSAGKSKQVHGARVDEARVRLADAVRALPEERDLQLELPGTRVPAGRTVVAGRRMQLHRDGKALFCEGGVDLAIRGPERIALTGANGAGKTSLLRLIGGELTPATGEIKRAEGRTAYLSQRLDLLDMERSVIENLQACAPAMAEVERMNLLARFQFRAARAQLAVGALSGGERLRATLACVLYAEPAPQLLLLDEPTNNLDLATVAQLQAALKAYEGALVVVSHDRRFLREIALDRWLELSEGRLIEVE